MFHRVPFMGFSLSLFFFPLADSLCLSCLTHDPIPCYTEIVLQLAGDLMSIWPVHNQLSSHGSLASRSKSLITRSGECSDSVYLLDLCPPIIYLLIHSFIHSFLLSRIPKGLYQNFSVLPIRKQTSTLQKGQSL